jgi:hypothetical protein
VKKNKTKKDRPYTIDEFLDHFQAMTVVRRYQHISRRLEGGPEQIEIGDDDSCGAQALRVMDYFGQIYSDKDEASAKSVVFILALSHLAKYQTLYDSERFAVFSKDQASMISLPLLKSIHYHFTRCHYRDLPNEDDLVEAVKTTAREYMKE